MKFTLSSCTYLLLFTESAMPVELQLPRVMVRYLTQMEGHDVSSEKYVHLEEQTNSLPSIELQPPQTVRHNSAFKHQPVISIFSQHYNSTIYQTTISIQV